ncbi:unnamed protein product [Paramecium pentaurelia]|uniref:EGF-like domain-containing protein n=1 Tax=Paramecium pentaurelia TaxID=43138 RepID=A0A8S1S5S5_9CILI|nr:unnamed protein product [Paramecium pentaurelia]
MFFKQKECFLLLIFCLQVFATLRLLDLSFTDNNIQNNNQIMARTCTNAVQVSFQTKNCNQNPLNYVQLTRNQEYISKSFQCRSFQVQIVLDVFFIEADLSNSKFKVSLQNSANEQVIYSRIYKRDDLTQNSGMICNNFFDDFEFLTISSTINNLDAKDFVINICFDPDDPDMEIGIRNMLIYDSCYPTCLTCNGPSKTDYLTCFDNQSVQSGQCLCISEQQYSETDIGCRQECDRDYSIANQDKICVQDNRIKSKFTLFDNSVIPLSNQDRYQPFIFLADIFHPKNTDLIYENCNGISFIGKFQFSEGMLYQMDLQNSVKFLRIRLTFYLFDFQESSKIEIIYDNQIYSRIIKLQQNDICETSFTLLRIEIIYSLFNSYPAIKIQGQLQEVSESWGFRNVTVDTGFCQMNCVTCLDNSKCSSCEIGYQLYRNQCVQYLVKGFYNLNMTLEEISSYYDTFSTLSQNFATQQKFSFLNNKIVLGGLLVWNDGSFTKTWIIQKPHYAVSIYFNLTYGDGYTGSFYYKVGSPTNGYQGPYNNPGGGQNLIGRLSLENTRFFQIHLDNFQNNNLFIELKCQAISANIKQGFCAISDYFIIVHYCPPFCQDCISSSICTTWQSGYTSSSCQSNQYLNFDQQTETYSCNNCVQSSCSICISADECVQCFSDQFQLTNGICLCKPFTYLLGNTCIQCNRYCESCFGATSLNCLSCIKEFHRSIQQNQCLCNPGYYDDGINLICLPKCGDQIIVEEEDCDDGNNDPFDGCYQCQFICQEECKVCLYGKCYSCKDNYYLVEAINKCKPICGDLIMIINEQCDDSNNHVFDGCHHCKLQCYAHCLKCNQGICEKCDEQNGWYLTGVNCEFICGDGILAERQEQCDDSNLNPFDLCYLCEQECSQHCIFCQIGYCLECEIGFQYVDENRQCIQICGDNLIVENEQCEDHMLQFFQICENCQFKCNHNCNMCNFGKCQQCKVGYTLINNECIEICGDGYVVGTEVCDKLIQNINSDCYNCNHNCRSGCLVCNYGICQICKVGYFLEQFQCKPSCGDQLIVDLEQCDDGNLIPYDGCHNCNYSCEINCKVCLFGQCTEMDEPNIIDIDNEDPNSITFDCIPDCKICNQNNICLDCGQHFQLINSKCVPICGDGIIIEGLEECDDGNNLPDDGCFECQFQCSDGCVECQKNSCKKCDKEQFILDIQTGKCLEKNYDQNNNDTDYSISEFQYYTNFRCGENQLLIDNVCVNQCGNGILVNHYEECDDGNSLGGDGCSSFCNIENSYKCINRDGSLSLCSFIKAPEFILNILSDKMNSTQIVELTFTQQVKLYSELMFEEIAFFTFTSKTQYLLSVSYIQNISIHLSYPKYQILIEFIEPLVDPILQVDIAKSIIQNSYEQDLQDHQKMIVLGTPFVLPETAKKQLTSIVQINDVMLYSMASVSGLALLTGNAIMFFNLLDLLQSLSYIKYMQYQFPPHVTEFLNTYTKVSLQPIMNYFQVDQLLAKLNGGTLPYQISNKSQKKTPVNSLNQIYLINAKNKVQTKFQNPKTYTFFLREDLEKVLKVKI